MMSLDEHHEVLTIINIYVCMYSYVNTQSDKIAEIIDVEPSHTPTELLANVTSRKSFSIPVTADLSSPCTWSL